MPAVIASVRGRLWLLIHDDDLRPRIPAGAIGVGLVAAALTDLLLDGCVRVEQGRIHPQADRSGPAGDAIAAEFLQAIVAERMPRLAEVLRGVRSNRGGARRSPYGRLYERTAAGFVDAGLLRRARLPIGRCRYRLAEPNLMSAIRAQLTDRLHDPQAPAGLDVDALCGLAWALDLHKGVCPGVTGEAERTLRDITELLPARAGRGSALAVMPHLVRLVRSTAGSLTVAPF